MGIINSLLQVFAQVFTRVGWIGLLLVVGAHATITFIVLSLANEQHLLAPDTFVYWYVTTASTVGYGDLSPQTSGGRLFVAFWVMLGGIALMTTVIGKVTNTVIDLWRIKLKGKGDFTNHRDHTVVVGWNGEQSERIIELLLQDETSNDDRIVLCDDMLTENPMPDRISFVRGESLSSEALLTRAGVAGAERILVTGKSDDQTLTAVLTLNRLSPNGHVVAHFDSSETARLARAYAPRLECTSNLAIEMLVRSSQDPGSSHVINELLMLGEGATQYSLKLGSDFSSSYDELLIRLKKLYKATLIGFRPAGGETVHINPDGDTEIQGGAEIFYIAGARLSEEALV